MHLNNLNAPVLSVLRSTLAVELQRLCERELLLVGDRHLPELTEETRKSVFRVAGERVDIRTRHSLIQWTVT